MQFLDRQQLDRTLAVWRKAFGLFHHVSFPSSALSTELEPEQVRIWLEQRENSLPKELRPVPEELAALVLMLRSFPTTSMNRAAVQLRSGSNCDIRRKANASADVLKVRALERLAEAHHLGLAPDAWPRLRADINLHRDLILVTYAVELMRRTEFVSQGLAVYWLWLQLEPEVRHNLSVELVAAAEVRLAAFLERMEAEFLAA